jgi:hypothetical protein
MSRIPELLPYVGGRGHPKSLAQMAAKGIVCFSAAAASEAPALTPTYQATALFEGRRAKFASERSRGTDCMLPEPFSLICSKHKKTAKHLA